MKKMAIAMMAVFFVVSVAGLQAAFTPPTGQQIKAAAQDPALIKDLLKDASAAQASGVVLHTVQQVQVLDLTAAQKKERVGKLFAVVQETMGATAVLVISDVARRINPDLLPAVAAPGAAIVAQPALPIAHPLAPPVAPIGTPTTPTTPPAPPAVPPYPGQ